MEHFVFNSTQTHNQLVNGKRSTVTEAVSVRNGKGMKTVVKRVDGKTRSAKRLLTKQEMRNIMKRKFMANLFTPCHKDCLKQQIKVRKTMKQMKTRSK